MTVDPSRRRLQRMLGAFLRGNLVEDYFTDDPHRRFYRKLYFEMFRHYGCIRRVLGERIQRKPHIDAESALIIGTAQILFMDDIPPYAAVSTAVELAPNSATKFVNAVLRRISDDREAILASRTVTDDFPEWLVKRWRNRLGESELGELLAALNDTPPLTAFAPSAGTVISDTSFDDLPENAHPMDAASIMIPRLAGTAHRRRILDACAAPGGKTMVLATDHPDANITAIEVQKDRADAMAVFLENKGITNGTILQDDMLSFAPEDPFDLVLLDAPCTALGTMRRHPEVRWLRTLKDVQKAAQVQKKMLEHAATLVKPGGRLIYSVCSLEPEEGAMQVSRFIDAHPEFTLIRPDAPDAFIIDDMFTAWPHRTNTDGFFAAVLERTP